MKAPASALTALTTLALFLLAAPLQAEPAPEVPTEPVQAAEAEAAATAGDDGEAFITSLWSLDFMLLATQIFGGGIGFGVGYGFAFVVCVAYCGVLWEGRERSVMLGIMTGVGGAASIVFSYVAGVLSDINWVYSFWFMTAFILVVGAIVAYLIKSGNKKGVVPVYIGAAFAVVCSFAMATLLSWLKSINPETTMSQEIIEGFAALLAVVVLRSMRRERVVVPEEELSGHIPKEE